MKIEIVTASQSGKTYEIENVFVASRQPLFLGLILKPSDAAWNHIKSTKEILVNGKELKGFTVKYGIEVGESSIFFITPSKGSVTFSMLSDIVKSS